MVNLKMPIKMQTSTANFDCQFEKPIRNANMRCEFEMHAIDCRLQISVSRTRTIRNKIIRPSGDTVGEDGGVDTTIALIAALARRGCRRVDVIVSREPNVRAAVFAESDFDVTRLLLDFDCPRECAALCRCDRETTKAISIRRK